MKTFLLIMIIPVSFLVIGLMIYPFDKCGQRQIDREVGKVVKFMADTEKGRELQGKLDHALESGVIRPEDKDEFINSVMEVVVRHKKGCEVPEELQQRSSALMFQDEVTGTLQCEKDKYLSYAQEQYAGLQSQDGYPEFEQWAKQEILNNMNVDVSRDMFTERWDVDPTFRSNVIIAVLQMAKRDEEGCNNVVLPIIPIMMQMADKTGRNP